MMREADGDMAAGLAALQRGSWAAARASFEAAIDSGDGGPDAHMGLGNAFIGLGEMASAFESYETAYLRHRADGNDRGAGRVAVRLAWNSGKIRGEPSVANGWTRRAHRLLDPLQTCFEQARLTLVEADALLFAARDPESAGALARRAQAIGRTVGDPDSELVGLALDGLADVSVGHPQEGMAKLDEAAAATIAGEARELLSVGITYCYLIFACEKVRDFDRAGEWCTRLQAFTERTAHHGLLGVCRAHHAGVLISGGEWAEAEEVLGQSRVLLATHARGMAPEAELRLAELRRRQGRLMEAEALLREPRATRWARWRVRRWRWIAGRARPRWSWPRRRSPSCRRPTAPSERPATS